MVGLAWNIPNTKKIVHRFQKPNFLCGIGENNYQKDYISKSNFIKVISESVD